MVQDLRRVPGDDDAVWYDKSGGLKSFFGNLPEAPSMQAARRP